MWANEIPCEHRNKPQNTAISKQGEISPDSNGIGVPHRTAAAWLNIKIQKPGGWLGKKQSNDQLHRGQCVVHAAGLVAWVWVVFSSSFGITKDEKRSEAPPIPAGAVSGPTSVWRLVAGPSWVESGAPNFLLVLLSFHSF